MAVIGNIGYLGSGTTVFGATGNTHIYYMSDAAIASGVINQVTIRKKTNPAGTIRVSIWRDDSPAVYTRVSSQVINVPVGTGTMLITLPSPLNVQIGQYFGYYSSDVELYFDGGKNHKHYTQVGDVSVITLPSAVINNAPSMYADIEAAAVPPSSLGSEGIALSKQQAINAARSRKGYKPYEDSLFVAGDSPVELNVATDLGENAHTGYIYVDRSDEAFPEFGDIQVEFAEGDGSSYGDAMTIQNVDVMSLDGMDINKIRLTHTGDNCAYYIFVKRS